MKTFESNINYSAETIIDKTFISSYLVHDLKSKKIVTKNVPNNCLKDLLILKQCIKDVGYDTTLHGLPHVLNSKNRTLKYMW
jgi:hypothetical protein